MMRCIRTQPRPKRPVACPRNLPTTDPYADATQHRVNAPIDDALMTCRFLMRFRKSALIHPHIDAPFANLNSHRLIQSGI